MVHLLWCLQFLRYRLIRLLGREAMKEMAWAMAIDSLDILYFQVILQNQLWVLYFESIVIRTLKANHALILMLLYVWKGYKWVLMDSWGGEEEEEEDWFNDTKFICFSKAQNNVKGEEIGRNPSWYIIIGPRIVQIKIVCRTDNMTSLPPLGTGTSSSWPLLLSPLYIAQLFRPLPPIFRCIPLLRFRSHFLLPTIHTTTSPDHCALSTEMRRISWTNRSWSLVRQLCPGILKITDLRQW